MRRYLIILTVLATVAAACTNGDATDPTNPSTTSPSSAPTTTVATPAPEFPDGLDWLNVEQPLDLASLRGKVVLLDFWTYGCINCIHIIPDLKRLEAEFPEELVVIGVHSAKFDNEGNTENIREVTQRYDLTHPVVNDASFEIWNAWGARAWPTVALIDPGGNAVGVHAGEGVYDVVQPVVARLVEEFGVSGQIDPTPLPLLLERERTPDTLLSYPGKVHADPSSDRLFIADSGHHRIIAATDDGTVTAVFGSGVEGFEDGIGLDAAFSSPQVAAGAGDAELILDVRLPEGYKVNKDASSSLVLVDDGGVVGFPDGSRVDLTGATFPVVVPIELRAGAGTVATDLALVWCREDAEGLCLFEQTRFEIPLDVSASGPSASIRLPQEITAVDR